VSRRHWYDGRPAISFRLKAGPDYHRITWGRGRLVLHDHDLEAERVLQALGGEPCRCMRVLDGCRDPYVHLAGRQRGWGAYSAAGLQPPMTRAPVPAPTLAQLGAFARRARPGWHAARDLPEQMRDVFEGVMAVRMERKFRQPPPAPAPLSGEARLQAAAAPAAEEAMRRCRRDLRPYATFTVGCWRQKPDEERLINGYVDSTGGTLAMSLPLSWLNRIWCRGLAVVQGHLVLEVDHPAPATELEGWAVRWERRLAGRSTPIAAPCLLRRGVNGFWALSWT
jgi:hypothetical protein